MPDPWIINFQRDRDSLPAICESVTILRRPPLDREVEMVVQVTTGSTWIAEGDSCRFAIGEDSFNLGVIRATIEHSGPYEKQTLRLVNRV